MVDLGVRLGDLWLKNPVLTASGTFGHGTEYSDFIDLERLGGFIVKGTTLLPREGNPYPRMIETPSGMLNAVGLQNKGIEYFCEHIYPTLSGLDTEVIVNVCGSSVEDYVAVAERLECLDEIHAIELNISCPNVKEGCMAFGRSAEGAAAVTAAVRKAWSGHLMVKLSPNVADIAEIARAVEAVGADSVSLINTLLGMSIDVERRRPSLPNITGGLSGPAVRPIAVRMVYDVFKAINIPIVGLGGIACTRDALEFIMAGARAIEIGTANFVDPEITVKIIDGLNEFCQNHGVSNINELVGCAH